MLVAMDMGNLSHLRKVQTFASTGPSQQQGNRQGGGRRN